MTKKSQELKSKLEKSVTNKQIAKQLKKAPLKPLDCYMVVNKKTGKWDRFSVYFSKSEFKGVRLHEDEEIRKITIKEVK